MKRERLTSARCQALCFAQRFLLDSHHLPGILEIWKFQSPRQVTQCQLYHNPNPI